MKTKQTIRYLLTALFLLLIGLGTTANLHAHEIRPALLTIDEQKPGWFDVTWKIPVLPGYEVDLTPILPESLAPYGPPASHDLP